MADQDWLTPASVPAPSPYQNVAAAPSTGAPAYELRPLSLGELLDRTFSLYRSRFWLFCGIAAMGAAIELVVAGIGRVGVHRFTNNPTMVYTADLVITYAASFIYFFFYCVTQAATSFAMAEVYLNRPASIGSSFRAVGGKWYAWVGIGWWQVWSAMWVFTLLFIPFIAVGAFRAKIGIAGGAFLIGLMVLGIAGASAYGVIAYIRNSLAIPVKVVEGLTVRKAMRRSKDLAAGAKVRIMVVGLIVWALYVVFGVTELPFAVMTLAATSGTHVFAEMSVLLITFAAHSVVTPVASIGLCLIYFDQRVRREAFDLEVLLGPEQADALPGSAGTFGPGVETPAVAPVETETHAPLL